MMVREFILSFLEIGIHFEIDGEELLISGNTKALSAQDIAALKARKIEISAYLSSKGERLPPPRLNHMTGNYELIASNAQKNLHFLESLDESGKYYNIPVTFRIRGKLNIIALKHAVDMLILKHHILRTHFDYIQGELVQRVTRFDTRQVNFSSINLADSTQSLRDILAKEANYNFDLANEWPIKATVFELKSEAIFSLNIHHIATDGLSAKIIVDELSSAYSQHNFGHTSPNKQPVYQYADFCVWQQKYFSSKRFGESKSYWKEKLSEAPQIHQFPIEYARPKVQSVVGANFKCHLGQPLSTSIKLRAQQLNVSPFLLVQSLFAGFLSRYSGESDILFGSVFGNRFPNEFSNSVGMFANTLPMRYQLPPKCTFNDLVAQAKSVNSEAKKHQQFPFEAIIESLLVVRDSAYNPLLQIMIVSQDDALEGLAFPETEIEVLDNKQKVSKFDFTLHTGLNGDDFEFDWEYKTALFSQTYIERISVHFIQFIGYHIDNMEAELSMFIFDKQQLKINPILLSDFPKPCSIYALIDNAMQSCPQNIAIKDGDTSLSYAQLGHRVTQLANHLATYEHAPHSRYAVYMDKSTEMVVAMLAILKLGGVYVPFDPYYPKERLAFMCQDANVSMILTDNSVPASKALADIAAMLDVTHVPQTDSKAVSFNQIAVDSAAYIIYTSGSTGNPKGVLVSHQSLFYSLMANKQVLGMTATDAMPTIGSQAFGVSLLEILLPLSTSGRIDIVAKSATSDLTRLIKTTNQSTVVHLVPSLMSQWLDVVQQQEKTSLYPNLRTLLVGAEPVPDALLKRVKQWRPDVVLRVLYGMTESAVVSSSFEKNDASPQCYCIGQPHPNMSFYVLNAGGVPQPKGVAGELYVGGLSLATEYLNQGDLTREKFTHHALLKQRLYRTGDRVREIENGYFEFLGRTDHQVSLRGVRIETGEIESFVHAISGVNESIAHVKHLENGDNVFILYFTVKPNVDGDALVDVVRDALKVHFPDQMRPSLINMLAAFPLNPNGKIDRKNLPMPQVTRMIEAPQTEVEHYLAQAWCLALEIDTVSTTVNFFEVGGHSLMATKLVNKINQYYTIKLPLIAFFDAPTIQICAKLVEQTLEKQLIQTVAVPVTAEGDSHICGTEELII